MDHHSYLHNKQSVGLHKKKTLGRLALMSVVVLTLGFSGMVSAGGFPGGSGSGLPGGGGGSPGGGGSGMPGGGGGTPGGGMPGGGQSGGGGSGMPGGSSGGSGYMKALEDPFHVQELYRILEEGWIAAFSDMTATMIAGMMNQMASVGGFLDAQNTLDSMRSIQQQQAQIQTALEPNDQMCRFGTNAVGLAASQQKMRANAQIINKMLMDRELLTTPDGVPENDIQARLAQYKQDFCTPADSNGHTSVLCSMESGAPAAQVNRDINFTSLMNSNTLDIDFTDTTLTADEAAILALSKNIFSYDTFPELSGKLVAQEAAQDDYGDIRSVHAIRSVARNSFANLIAMKAKGDGSAAPFMHSLVKDLGVPEEEISAYLGESPSYFAQMDVMTKKMYQNPAFLTDMVTTPENVDRTGASMQAIKLMQDRDRFESSLRREMLISLVLELKVRELQNQVTNDILAGGSNLYIIPISGN